MDYSLALYSAKKTYQILLCTGCLFFLTKPSAYSQAIVKPVAESDCATVAESDPPFLVVDSGSAGAVQLRDGAGIKATSGYIPKNSIVRLKSDDSGILENIPFAGVLLEAEVLSVPAPARTEMDPATGRISQSGLGRGARAIVGQQIHVKKEDLLPLVGSFVPPGSLVESRRSVFVVRRDSPYYNIPELKGHALRLAQDGLKYLTKKCCVGGVKPSDSWVEKILPSISEYPSESKRDPNCTYTPIFDLLRDTGKNGRSVFELERQVAIQPCDRFVAGLQAGDLKNLSDLLFLNSALNRFSNNQITKMQTVAYRNAIKPRCVSQDDKGVCALKVSGNRSKALCRTAVRETLEELGLLKNHPPGEAAEDLFPWLGTQGFTNAISTYRSSDQAPVGAILVYSGGEYGHVEMRVGRNAYCSDFCTDHPIDQGRLAGARKLVGIYVPKGFKK